MIQGHPTSGAKRPRLPGPARDPRGDLPGRAGGPAGPPRRPAGGDPRQARGLPLRQEPHPQARPRGRPHLRQGRSDEGAGRDRAVVHARPTCRRPSPSRAARRRPRRARSASAARARSAASTEGPVGRQARGVGGHRPSGAREHGGSPQLQHQAPEALSVLRLLAGLAVGAQRLAVVAQHLHPVAGRADQQALGWKSGIAAKAAAAPSTRTGRSRACPTSGRGRRTGSRRAAAPPASTR